MGRCSASFLYVLLVISCGPCMAHVMPCNAVTRSCSNSASALAALAMAPSATLRNSLISLHAPWCGHDGAAPWCGQNPGCMMHNSPSHSDGKHFHHDFHPTVSFCTTMHKLPWSRRDAPCPLGSATLHCALHLEAKSTTTNRQALWQQCPGC